MFMLYRIGVDTKSYPVQHEHLSDMLLSTLEGIGPGGGGGVFRNIWVGMCRWDPGTLNLYQS